MSRPGALIGTHHPKAQPASEDACGRPVCEGFGQVGLGFGERPRAPPSRGTAIEHRVARVATEHSGRLGNARESAVFLGNVLQYVFAAERRPPDARKAQFQWLCKMEAGSGIEPLYEDLQSRQFLFPNSPETAFILSLQALTLRLGMPPSSATFREHPGAITQDLHDPARGVMPVPKQHASRARTRIADIFGH